MKMEEQTVSGFNGRTDIRELGEIAAQGFLDGLKSIARERIANNALKMSGMPMRRKKSRKDKRGEIRRSVIEMNRILKTYANQIKR